MSEPLVNKTPGFAFDAELELHDGGLITASGAGQVDAVAAVATIGAARWEGYLVMDIDAVEQNSADDSCRVLLQGSENEDFSADIQNLAVVDLGHADTLLGGADAVLSAGDRIAIPVTNVLGSVVYPHLRLYSEVAGAAVATGWDFRAYLTRRT